MNVECALTCNVSQHSGLGLIWLVYAGMIQSCWVWKAARCICTLQPASRSSSSPWRQDPCAVRWTQNGCLAPKSDIDQWSAHANHGNHGNPNTSNEALGKNRTSHSNKCTTAPPNNHSKLIRIKLLEDVQSQARGQKLVETFGSQNVVDGTAHGTWHWDYSLLPLLGLRLSSDAYTSETNTFW